MLLCGGFDSSLLFATFLVAGICVKPILTHLYYAMLFQKKLLHPGLDKILEVKHVITLSNTASWKKVAFSLTPARDRRASRVQRRPCALQRRWPKFCRLLKNQLANDRNGSEASQDSPAALPSQSARSTRNPPSQVGVKGRVFPEALTGPASAGGQGISMRGKSHDVEKRCNYSLGLAEWP